MIISLFISISHHFKFFYFSPASSTEENILPFLSKKHLLEFLVYSVSCYLFFYQILQWMHKINRGKCIWANSSGVMTQSMRVSYYTTHSNLLVFLVLFSPFLKKYFSRLYRNVLINVIILSSRIIKVLFMSFCRINQQLLELVANFTDAQSD